MIHLNAGNLWEERYLSKVIELNDAHKDDEVRVDSLFGSISTLTPTARSHDRIPFLNWNDIGPYVRKALDAGINIRYTLNASCLGSIQDFKHEWEGKLKDSILRLQSLGIREWTVTSPLVCQLLRELFPEDFIEVSTIVELDTPGKAACWKEFGASGANLSTNINRDLSMVDRIAGIPFFTVSLLANEACLYNCPYRRDCYNLSSHDSFRGEQFFNNYPFRWCNMARLQDASEWLKARMILPQWMDLYQEKTGVSWFKVAYRTHPYEVAIPILEMYMNKYYGGNYLDLWPSIRHLGDTIEPKDIQYLSCVKLDEMEFLENKFLEDGYQCAFEECGTTCHYCESAAKKASVRE